jgi:MFS transporter, SP family, general alpha glucoside:H+ symporter
MSNDIDAFVNLLVLTGCIPPPLAQTTPLKMEAEKQNTAAHSEEVRNDLANIIEQEDHETNKIQAIKRHPWAFFWAVYGAWQIMLLAYENNAAGLVTGIPRFRQDFGFEFEGQYVLPAAWQAAHSGGPIAS